MGIETLEELIKSKREQILRRVSDSIINTDEFRKLSSLFKSFWDSRPSKEDFFFIVLEIQHISEIAKKSFSIEIRENLNKALQVNNHIKINENFEIIEECRYNFEFNNEARGALTEMSKDGYCVFFFSPVGIHHFADGVEMGDAIFYTDKLYKTYLQKKDISEIEEVIDEYREKLKIKSRYQKFFVQLSTIRALFEEEVKNKRLKNGKKPYKEYILKNRNILKNKPEDSFREDLREYLQDKIKASFNFSKEVVLDSQKRLDINTEDEVGNFYFFEIKWIGLSISSNNQNIQTEYTPDNIKESAVEQVLKYIKELRDKRKVVKAGYLVVFDARMIHDGDSCQNYDYSNIEASLEPYRAYFNKFNDLIVDNLHPS